MKRIALLGILSCLGAGLTYAANFNGKLMDEACWTKSSASAPPETAKKTREDAAKSCAPSAATTSFALEVSKSKVYKLDSDGNTKAASEFKSGTLKPDNDGDVHATVSGTLEGDTIKVDSVSAGGRKKG